MFRFWEKKENHKVFSEIRLDWRSKYFEKFIYNSNSIAKIWKKKIIS